MEFLSYLILSSKKKSIFSSNAISRFILSTSFVAFFKTLNISSRKESLVCGSMISSFCSVLCWLYKKPRTEYQCYLEQWLASRGKVGR